MGWNYSGSLAHWFMMVSWMGWPIWVESLLALSWRCSTTVLAISRLYLSGSNHGGFLSLNQGYDSFRVAGEEVLAKEALGHGLAAGENALGYVNRFGVGIGLVADELKANGNPPAEYVFSEPSSFKVIVRSADPHVHSSETHDSQGGTHVETHVGTQDGTHVKSIREERQDKLIQLVHMHPEFTMEEMAGEMGISRTSVYRLIKSMNGKVKYNGDQYHGEWIVIEREGE